MGIEQTPEYPISKTFTRRLGSIWYWLTEPVATIQEPEQRRQARLLASLLISLMLLNILSSIVQLLTVPGFMATFMVLTRTFIILAIAYGLSRTKYYKLGAFVTVVIPSIAVFTNLFVNPDDIITLAFITVGILVCSIFFSIRATAFLAAINIVSVLSLPVVIPGLIMSGAIIGPLSFVVIMSALILVAAHHRNQIEEDRQAVLAEREERFRQAFNNAPIGMALIGLDQRFLQVNQALCDILGYLESELLATDVPSITHPDDLKAEEKYKGPILNGTGQSYAIEKRYIHADGHIVWGQLSVSLVTQ